MADGTANSLERTERGLTYPQPTLPLAGEAVEVAKGVLWLRHALPMALDHINVYAIRDGDGWVIVDTGLDTPTTRADWERALAGSLQGLPVNRLIVTHMHPDHLGLAGWLTQVTGATFMISRLEYLSARMHVAEDMEGATPQAEAFYRRQGWDDAAIERWKSRFGRMSRSVSPLPPQYARLSEGDVLTIGDDEWTVVIGEGHSPEHVCLWRKSDGVIIAGDQILPKISSNIGVWDTEPMADPLKDWLESLEALKQRLPSDLLVLPSHGEPFYGVTTRLDALLRGHEVGLKRLGKSLRQKCRSIDVFGALFARTIGPELLGMATAEALAHLNYLEGQGRAVRETDEQGVEWWIGVERDQ
ncbi:MBL fold metallo-hydrolase [uncultured Brevundimonas sp.]|uniref:MBL fold metallo-hydrolase n=1 Tax=uncultured Brevundimonas sp. TaxID=213418 RepID=UPI00261D5F37|nr:MBL fold metallo-hydrolase [uncultured Brevundimonas sp.]